MYSFLFFILICGSVSGASITGYPCYFVHADHDHCHCAALSALCVAKFQPTSLVRWDRDRLYLMADRVHQIGDKWFVGVGMVRQEISPPIKEGSDFYISLSVNELKKEYRELERQPTSPDFKRAFLYLRQIHN